jgi:hypothetical protein
MARVFLDFSGFTDVNDPSVVVSILNGLLTILLRSGLQTVAVAVKTAKI